MTNTNMKAAFDYLSAHYENTGLTFKKLDIPYDLIMDIASKELSKGADGLFHTSGDASEETRLKAVMYLAYLTGMIDGLKQVEVLPWDAERITR